MSCDNDWLPWSLSNTGHAFFLGVVAANVYLDLLVEQGVVAVLDYPGFGWDRGMGLYLGRPCSLDSCGGLALQWDRGIGLCLGNQALQLG